ncbi:patched domain-containing protein 3-like [Tachypleus tridentatus]|uniref:patched domain-containing protein 3-like n=1 Tax=Tachypleus tridentatus TaxID=6853 RepID=UPI003FD42B6A
MKYNCVDRLVSWAFGRLGYYVGSYPGYFIIVPFLVGLLLATGLQRIVYEDNPEYLFSPVDGRSHTERNIIETFFPMNTSRKFDLGRMTRIGRLGRVIIDAKDGRTVLREYIFNEMQKLDTIIQNITITWDGGMYKYKDLCARTKRGCFHNDILDFKGRIRDIESRKYLLEYPIMFNRATQKIYHMLGALGGVTVDELGFVQSALAYSLIYPLDVDIKHGIERAQLWENQFLLTMKDIEMENITIGYFVSNSLESELEKNTQSVIPFFSITMIIMLGFSVVTCMMSDCVRSKPWLGILGSLSTIIAVAGAFGLVVYCGMVFIGINLAAPFLMLGIGMDDTFVLLAAWRRTDRKKPVEERMSEAYMDAAVSITITSLTNFISFLIGVITPFPSVQIFCTYTAVSVLFAYIWQITFFGGCMTVCGYAENRNLNNIFCVPAIPRSVAISEKKNAIFRLLCAGGVNPDDPDNLEDNKDHIFMVFFRDSFGKFLSNKSVKMSVLLMFFIYLGVGIWGCTMVKEGLERQRLSRYDSYSVTFYNMEDKYFRKYPYRIQIVVADELNYADPEIQENIEKMLKKFESANFIANSSLTESWLRAYLEFQKDDRSFFLLDGFNLTKKEDFIEALRSIFFRMPHLDNFEKDIVFNENGTSIVSSRFMIQSQDVLNANEEKDMVLKLREIADSFPFNVIVFQQYFIFWDQFILVRGTSIQSISVAAAVMMVILLIFIPKPVCAMWVAFSIVSIEIGVIGYMTLWNVNLDSISMINLIMCIGFSVDYSAHISYAYISSEKKMADERMRYALYSLGMPILQGSLSTILGIISLAFAPSYIFLTFFKTVFLVILFGALHGTLLLPVLLSLSDFCYSKKKSSIPELWEIPHTLYQLEKPGLSPAPLSLKDSIKIPRPSHVVMLGITDLQCAQVDSEKGSRETSSCNNSGDKDFGIGTSGEESSENSWKGRDMNPFSQTQQFIGYSSHDSIDKGECDNPAFEAEEEIVAYEQLHPTLSSRNSSRMTLYHIDSRTGLFDAQRNGEQYFSRNNCSVLSARSLREWNHSGSRTRDSISDDPLSFATGHTNKGY